MRKNNLTHLLSVFAIAALAAPTLAQNDDPFVKKPSPKKTATVVSKTGKNMARFHLELPRNILVNYEVFSVPIAEAPKLYRGGFTHKALYAALTENPEKHSATLEEFASLMLVPGQRGTSESVSEHIYPTEYEPPGDFSHILPDNPEPKIIPAVPTAFDVRKLGVTIEVECQVSSDPRYLPLTEEGANLLVEKAKFEKANRPDDPFEEQLPDEKENPIAPKIIEALAKGDLKQVTYIDTRISPIHVEEVGKSTWGEGPSEISMPTFDVQSIASGITLVSGEPTFIGTMNPHPESKKHTGGKRVWFAFLTTTAMKAGL